MPASEPIATRATLAITAVILVAVLVGAIECFALIWHRSAFEDLLRRPDVWPATILICVLGAALHELLHVVSWKLSTGVPWNALALRRSRRKLGVIAQITVPVESGAYAIGVAAPAVLLGVVPIAGGLAVGSGMFVLCGGLLLFESFSDLAILMAIRGLPPTTRVVERTDVLGCRICRAIH